MSNIYDYDETEVEITDYSNLDDSVKTIIVTSVTVTALSALTGGTRGQVLSKNSSTDNDFIWTNNVNAVTLNTVSVTDVPYLGAVVGDKYFTITKNIDDLSYIPISTIFTSSQQSVLDSGINASLVAKILTNESALSAINALIPTEASSSNKLADKNWVLNNSGKIDKIKLNTVEQPIVNKTVSLTVDKNTVGLGNVNNTPDSATPIEGGTDKFTTGGAYTELAKKQDVMQYVVLPTPTLSLVGTGPVQYIGNTTADYIHNYFYECHDTSIQGSITAANEQYSWVQSNVQPTVDIINNVISTDINKALSANQGKILQDQINTLKARGRFLSVWNATTGKPSDLPGGVQTLTVAYEFKTGDYYVVGTSGIKLPTGTSLAAGTTIANFPSVDGTTTQQVNDTIYFDGSSWTLIHTPQVEVAFSSLAGQPTDNANLASALNAKQNTLTSDQLAATNSGATSSKITSYDAHIVNTNNPHNVTKAQLGLGNVNNTSDANKPISTATQNALNNKYDKSGGTISGNVSILGELDISDDYVMVNSGNTTLPSNAGMLIPNGEMNTYVNGIYAFTPPFSTNVGYTFASSFTSNSQVFHGIDCSSGTLTYVNMIFSEQSIVVFENGNWVNPDYQVITIPDQVVIPGGEGNLRSILALTSKITGGIFSRQSVYAVVYDNSSSSVKTGLGYIIVDEYGNKTFSFAANQGQSLATRNDSDNLTNNHLLKWDATNYKLVDSGKSISDLQLLINSSNKLSSDLVDDTNHTNKFVTASQKSAIGTAVQGVKPSFGSAFSKDSENYVTIPTANGIAMGLSLNNYTDSDKQKVANAVQDTDYVLIESITINEVTASLSRTTEPDATSYNFKKLLVEYMTVDFPSGTTGSMDIGFKVKLQGVANANAVVHKTGVGKIVGYPIKACACFEIKNSRLFAYGGYSRGSVQNPAGVLEINSFCAGSIWAYQSAELGNQTAITNLTIPYTIPAGTLIKIYAVRA